jgi:membrane protein
MLASGRKGAKDMFSRIINFLNRDIWRIRLAEYSRGKAFLLKQLRILALAVRGYREDSCRFRASALTFYSLLSIVPVIAMVFGVAKGFGLDERMRTEITQRLQGQEEVADRILAFSDSLLKNAHGGLVAGVGVMILFWSIIKVLGNIEYSFNDIWGVTKARSLGRKFSDYLSLMLVCPILLVVASSATVVVNSQAKLLLNRIPFGSLLLLPLSLLPYCTLWIAFTFILIFMPNTKVKLRSGLIAGIVSGTLFQFAQWVYINLQIGVAKYGTIYGSFAALPLFLVWLQMSWLILLFGAEIAFAVQNVHTYEFEPDCLSISHSRKRLFSLLIAKVVVERFCEGKPAWDAPEISRALEIPIRLVRQILHELVEANVLSEMRRPEADKEVLYQPARDVETLTVKSIVDALENHGESGVPVVESEELKKLTETLTAFDRIVEHAAANVTLKKI